MGGGFQGGAWVAVSGWKAYLGDYADLSEDDRVRFTLLDSVMNGSFFVPMTCLSNGINAEFTFERGATDFCSPAWLVNVYLHLCAQSVSVSVSNAGCLDVAQADLTGTARTMYPIPCNLFLGCYCQGWSGSIKTADPLTGSLVSNGYLVVFSA